MKPCYIVLLSVLLAGCKPTPVVHSSGYPQLLSDWGQLEVRGQQLTVHSEATVYDLNTPLFSDYAQKFRSVWTPPGEGIEVTADGELNLPVGSVVTKTFYYNREGDQLVHTGYEPVSGPASEPAFGTSLDLDKVRLLETRVLVHTESGWRGLPYIWNQGQTEATLEITGGLIPLVVKGLGEFNYIVPDFNQCQGCHVTNVAAGGMRPIGLKAKHLDKSYSYAAPGLDQLTYLTERHAISGLEGAEYIVSARWQEPEVPLDKAARSYLDINCSHCHSRTGPADTSAMYLTLEETDAIHLGVCKPPVAAGQGTGGHLFGINPGHGQESILTFRLQSNDPGAMMPELGRTLVHAEGVELISNWIDKMAGDCG